MRWTFDTMTARRKRNAESTWRTLTELPEALDREWRHGIIQLKATHDLYVDGAIDYSGWERDRGD